MNNTLNSTKKDEIDFLLIGVSVVVGLIVVVIIYYVYTYTSKSVDTTTKTTASVVDANKMKEREEALEKEKDEMYQTNKVGSSQVFNIKDNLFSYDDAEAVCRAYGAELADYTQMVDAYKKGANWCNYGWTKGQLALFPIQPEYWAKMQDTDDETKKGACGTPGINGGYFENKNLQFGVNCYGPKRAPNGEERIKSVFVSDKERELQQKVLNFKKQIGNFKLTPFNEDKWSN
jgi:hypothetical protein